MIENEIIIIGNDGRNELGILREFGEWNISPFLILIEKKLKKNYIVLKSSYVKRYQIFQQKEAEIGIVKFLKDNFKNNEKKPVIITTTDTACEMIDNHVEELIDDFYVSNIDGKNGRVHHYLDKYNTFLKAKEMGINVAETFVVTLDGMDNMDISGYPVPCILKPRESAHGEKQDIKICKNRNDLGKILKKFMDLGYNDIILQEYLDYDFEFSLHGWSANGKVFIPGVCKYLHKKSIGTNDYDYTQYIRTRDFEESEAVCKFGKMIKQLHFEGLFVGEAFYKDGAVYLNEINFRTCDLSYNETPSGHYIAPEFAAAVTGNSPKIFWKNGKRTFYTVLSFGIIKSILKQKMPLMQGLKEIYSASSFEYYAKGDVRPFLCVVKHILAKYIFRKEID